VIAMQCTDRNGELAGAVQVFAGDDVMLISNRGTMVRTRTEEISELSRNTQGVMLIRVAEDETLVGLARIEEPEDVEVPDDTEAAEDTAVSDDAVPADGGHNPDSETPDPAADIEA
jgi:DNA gyrase subunit A